MKQIIEKRFDIHINEAKGTVREQFELDKNVTKVLGLALSSDREDLLYNRGTQKIEINSEEIVPEHYESKRFMSGLNVSVNDRYKKINSMTSGNRLLKIEYVDADDGRTIFSAYRVIIYVECEIENL